jgi:hypothetical protein
MAFFLTVLSGLADCAERRSDVAAIARETAQKTTTQKATTQKATQLRRPTIARF